MAEKVHMTALELQTAAEEAGALRGHTEDNHNLRDVRRRMMRLIGEVWRLRAKCRWQAQRIKELETMATLPMLGPGFDAKAEPLA